MEIQPDHEPFYRDGTAIKPINSGDALESTIIDGDNNTLQNIALTSLKNVDEQSFINILPNGDFESWSNGASNPPDGWIEPSYVNAYRSTTSKINTYSVRAVGDSPVAGNIYHDVPDYTFYQSKTVCLGAWVYATSGNDIVQIQLFDGDSYSGSSVHPADSAWHWLTIQKTISGSATMLRALLSMGANQTGYFDGIIMVEGEVCPAFSPKPLIDDGKTITIDSNNNKVCFGGVQTVHRTSVGAVDYNPSALTSDYIIAMTNTAAARACIISTEDEDTGSAGNPRVMIIKDESMNCSVNNITISLESGGTIDGAANLILSVDGDSVMLYIDGTNAWVI